jgi:hypothetical protein
MSLQDQRRVLSALGDLSRDDPPAGVAVAAVDDAVGRRRGDLRTALSLQALADDGLAAEVADGRWALTPDGMARLERDRDASR